MPAAPYAADPAASRGREFVQRHEGSRGPRSEFQRDRDRIIYDELIVGKVTRDAERALKTMITVKEQDGAEAIVLACTELEMVVDVDANVLPIYDSTRIHAEKAAEWILGED